MYLLLLSFSLCIVLFVFVCLFVFCFFVLVCFVCFTCFFVFVCFVCFTCFFSIIAKSPSLSWSNGSWIYNYLHNQCISPLTLWVRAYSWRGVLDTILYDKVCQWLATWQWFSPGTPVSSTNKTDHHNIAEILWKETLSTKNQPNYCNSYFFIHSNYCVLLGIVRHDQVKPSHITEDKLYVVRHSVVWSS